MTSRLLGIAVGERRALVAELSANGGKPVVERTGEFVYPDGVTLSDGESLGHALGMFLRDRGYSARSAVVGIPGKWLLTKRVEAPAAEKDLVADSLRLQAEGEFAGDGGEFVFDYVGESSAAASRNVLLMACPQRQIDQLSAVLGAARLKAIAVMPSASALGSGWKDSRVLLFGPGGAEFVGSHGGEPRVVRYLGPISSPPAFLAGELRRASASIGNGRAASISLKGGRANGATASELLVWNDAGGAEAAAIESLGQSLGSPVRVGDVRALGVTLNGNATDAAKYAGPVSLALAGIESARSRAGAQAVDFLHSRLAPPKQVRVQRRTLVIAGAIAAVVLIAGGALLNLKMEQWELDKIQAQLKADAGKVTTARAAVSKVSFAKPWHDTDPITIACLNELTKALSDDGQMYLVSFNLNDARKGSFAGRAGNGEAVLALMDRLEASKHFEIIRPSLEAPRKPSGKSAPKPPTPSPTPAPQPQPQPQGPQMPPGMTLPPGVKMPANIPPEAMAAMQAAQAAAMAEAAKAGATISEAPVSLAMADGQPHGNPAMIVGSPTAGPAPTPMPTPAAPTPAPSGPSRPSRGEPKSGAVAAAGSGGEVPFVMNFIYKPEVPSTRPKDAK